MAKFIKSFSDEFVLEASIMVDPLIRDCYFKEDDKLLGYLRLTTIDNIRASLLSVLLIHNDECYLKFRDIDGYATWIRPYSSVSTHLKTNRFLEIIKGKVEVLTFGGVVVFKRPNKPLPILDETDLNLSVSMVGTIFPIIEKDFFDMHKWEAGDDTVTKVYYDKRAASFCYTEFSSYSTRGSVFSDRVRYLSHTASAFHAFEHKLDVKFYISEYNKTKILYVEHERKGRKYRENIVDLAL